MRHDIAECVDLVEKIEETIFAFRSYSKLTCIIEIDCKLAVTLHMQELSVFGVLDPSLHLLNIFGTMDRGILNLRLDLSFRSGK